MVERGAPPKVKPIHDRLLRSARGWTTPLLPDDYLALINPLWSTRELKGTVERIEPEMAEASTIVIRPSHDWPGHEPGQYLRIGVEIDGRRHWRAYSLTADPGHPEGLISITVKHVPEGLMSPHFTRSIEPGATVYLGGVEGTFGLPDPLPPKLLFVSAGSGITPIMSMLRELERRDALADVAHVHSERTAERVIFSGLLNGMAERHPGYVRHEHFTERADRLGPAAIAALCGDWRERHTLASGPGELLDALAGHWRAEGDPELLDMERFQPSFSGDGDSDGEGGTVRFRVTDLEATCGSGVPILIGGEDAGANLAHGCRMGICHTCVGRLAEGRVRDLRTGAVGGEPGQMVRICVNAPEGHVEIDL
jgi:stearoyl-CoA 9-desaturase NADPH oxidoreductase